MKISVITITCRTNPRLAEMARTLAAAQQRAKDVRLEWIVVDEVDPERAIHAAAPLGWADGFVALGVATPPTEHRAGPDRAVAHNTARNAGLFASSGDYIVMLNDCNIVSMDWASVARDCALQGVGWKCKTDVIPDMPVPADGIVKHKGHHDLLRPVPVMTVAGACWGAPTEAFKKIHGFDLVYDGQRKGNDVDAIVRLSRVGVSFVTTARAYTLQLRRTKVDEEVTTRKDVYAGAKNAAQLNALIRDKTRFLPVVEAVPPAMRAPVDLPPAPPAGVVQPPVPGDSRGGQHAAPVAHGHITIGVGGKVIALADTIAKPLPPGHFVDGDNACPIPDCDGDHDGNTRRFVTPEQLIKDETYKTITASHPDDLNELIEGRAKLVDRPDGTAAVLLEGESVDDGYDDVPALD